VWSRSLLFRVWKCLQIAPLDGVRVTRVSWHHARERPHVLVRPEQVECGRAEYAVESRQWEEVLMCGRLLLGTAIGACDMPHDNFDYIGHA
jgi:hypothetical protein